MTKEEYRKRLEKHDWFHFQSHDTRISVAGITDENDLKSYWEVDKDYAKMYKKYFKKIHGKPFPEPKKK